MRGFSYFDAKLSEANPLSIQSMEDDGIVADFLIETVANHIAAQHFSFQAHQSLLNPEPTPIGCLKYCRMEPNTTIPWTVGSLEPATLMKV